MSRSPRGTTTGGYFFKVVIFIKFKKYIVVALAVLCVVVSSCVSAFALSDEYASKDFYKSDYIQSFLKSDTHFNAQISKYKYFIVEAFYNSNNDDYFIKVFFTNDNVLYKSTTGAPAGRCSYLLEYKYLKTENCYRYSDSSNMHEMMFDTKDNLLLSNVDFIYDNKVFFQRPLTLLERLLNPVQSQMGEKVVADLGTLTICGISLIALLVGCSLVPKVLHKFRV